jgi:hypothetical protein
LPVTTPNVKDGQTPQTISLGKGVIVAAQTVPATQFVSAPVLEHVALSAVTEVPPRGEVSAESMPSVRPALQTIPLDLDALFPAPGVPLLGTLPVDVSALDASIKNFFAQVEEIGEQLSSHRLDLWISVGVMVAGTAVAVEIARRQARTPAPTLDPNRERSIP